MSAQLKPGWLLRAILSAAAEVAKWPKWRRDAIDEDDLLSPPGRREARAAVEKARS